MQYQDLLVRQIEQLGRVLGKILFNALGFNTKADSQEKLDKLNSEIQTELDLNLNEIINDSFEGFIESIQNDKRWNDENLSKLADVVIEASNWMNNETTHQTERRQYLQFSLNVLQFINERSLIYSFERNTKIEKIKEALKIN